MTLLDRIRSSVRGRITAVASLFVLLVTALGSVVVVAMIGHTISHSLVDSARQDAAAIRAQLGRGVTPAEAATTGRNDVVVQLVDGDGAVIASDRPSTEQVPLRTTPGVTETAAVPGLDDTFTIVAIASSTPGIHLIVVGRSTEQREETRSETAGILAVAVPLVVLVLGGILWVSVGRALRPVEVMRQEAGRIEATRVGDHLAVPPGDDEIPRLARTLNEMLDRIEEGQRLQQQFVSDASHELRSPLAAIRQSAEVARAHPERVRLTEFADDVLTEGARLEALVTSLLLLARSGAEGEPEEVDLDDVVLAEVSRLPPRDGVVVHTTGLGAARTLGSPVLLGHVVRNLLDNAVRHASSQVLVSLHEVSGCCVLTVDDDGDGIPVAERDRVFERFVRLDDARARDEGGSGLGLAIVARIVANHGGQVRAEESPLGGARLRVSLPAC